MADKRLLFPAKDVAWANAVVNHPAVLPGLNLGIFDKLDIGPLVANPRNHLLMGDYGGALLIWTSPGVYDVHDFVLPEGRGVWAKRAAQDVFDHAFSSLRARMIWTQTPLPNRASRMFNRILGFKSEGIHEVQLYPGAPLQEVEYFVMEAPHE